MSSACKSAVGCADSHIMPVRATYVNLYKWPESDAEFVKSVTRRGSRVDRPKFGPGPSVVDSYSCRQMYLRSYTFSTKKNESMPEKTRKCFERFKERTADLSIGLHRRRGSFGSFDSGSLRSMKSSSGSSNKKKKKKKKTCAGKLKEASVTAIRSVFRHLLSCTTSVDVVDGRAY